MLHVSSQHYQKSGTKWRSRRPGCVGSGHLKMAKSYKKMYEVVNRIKK